MDVKLTEDQIIALTFEVELDTFNVVNAYTPQVGLDKHVKIQLLEDLKGLIQKCGGLIHHKVFSLFLILL